MTQKQKGLLPKVEILIVAVFGISFFMWAVPKCNTKKNPFPNPTVATKDTTISKPTTNPIAATPTVIPIQEPKAAANDNLNRLFVTIDNLKLRKDPKLTGELLQKLPLFEEVYFLNEVTDSIFSINLGYEIAHEPWVKIQTKEKQVGWVFGAGVNYYKKKRRGVLE